MTKSLLEQMMNTLMSVVPAPLAGLAATVGSLVSVIDIPEDDERWREVAGGVEAILTRISEAADASPAEQMQIRLEAEQEFHRLLRQHGLIERG